VRVYLTHERFINTYVEFYETMEELKYKIMSFLNIHKDFYS